MLNENIAQLRKAKGLLVLGLVYTVTDEGVRVEEQRQITISPE